MAVMDFAWHAPTSLAEACELGRRFGADAAYLAGGTELFPDFQRDRETATHLIALERVGELRGLRCEGETLHIGALVTVAAIATSPDVHAWLPVLAEAARMLGSPPIRSRATIGGNFCRAVPCADLPPPAVAAGARLAIVGADGAREVDSDAFFTGPRQTALRPGDVLVEVRIPRQPAGSGMSYQRFARRAGSALAVASVAARLVLRDGVIADARIALGAVAPVPTLAQRAAAVLVGERPSDSVFALAAAESVEESLPISDLRASADFRRELVDVLTRRALRDAADRAMRRSA